MLRPDIRVESVQEVTPALLKTLGVGAVLVDLDDTLLAAADEQVAPDVIAWVRSLTAADFAVAILSNGERQRVRRIAEEAGVPGLSLAGKPFRMAFRKAMRLLGDPAPDATVMVGDQLFTDVLGAKRAGLRAILVRPLSPGKLPHTRLARRIERMLLKE